MENCGTCLNGTPTKLCSGSPVYMCELGNEFRSVYSRCSKYERREINDQVGVGGNNSSNGDTTDICTASGKVAGRHYGV
jgi:hypothetical protein